MRFVAEVADEPVHVRHGHVERRARLRDDIFLNHDAAQIVRAIFQSDLTDFQTFRDPRTLDVREVKKRGR